MPCGKGFATCRILSPLAGLSNFPCKLLSLLLVKVERMCLYNCVFLLQSVRAASVPTIPDFLANFS